MVTCSLLKGQVTNDQKSGGRYYLTVIVIVLTTLYLTPFFLVRTSFYDRWNPSSYSRAINYSYKAVGQNADVVIFGDSTALLGISPRQISSALKVKVLNLANTYPSLVVNNDLLLRRYLQFNRKPRMIIFYFAPWDFDYGHQSLNEAPSYQGEQVLLRHGTWIEIVAFARKHISNVLVFPFSFYESHLNNLAHDSSVNATQEIELDNIAGHMDLVDVSVLSAECRFPEMLTDNIRFDWVKALGERYKAEKIRVMYYAAPIPRCSNSSKVAAAAYERLPAMTPIQLPASKFADGAMLAHPKAFAVPEITRALIDAISLSQGDVGYLP